MKQVQRGAAVMMVLLIVALATSLAAYMAQQQSLWQRQLESQFDHAQAKRFGMAGIDWARAVLADDARLSQIDHETEIWTLRLPAMPVENGEVVGLIEDRQGRFNLNNLLQNGSVNLAALAQFKRLLNLLSLSPALANSVADWIDSDDRVQAEGGAEDAYYLNLPRPYRTANQPLLELGELVKIKGFDVQIIDRLRSFVTVLPSATTVNVNFASPEVLVALSGNMSVSDARMMVQTRRGKPFRDVPDFKNRLPNPTIQFNDSDLAVRSQYFWVTGQATVNQSQVVTQALLLRANGWPTVVWQSVQ